MPKTNPTNPELPRILMVRGQRIVLDSDLAVLYGVLTKRLNEAVRRNIDRFPREFAFQLSQEELANLKSQFATSSSGQPAAAYSGYGGVRKLPWAFTEHGALMAATVLNSPQAVQMSVYLVRAFVQMRDALLTNASILKRLAQIDKKLLEHDVVLRDVVEKLMPLLSPPPEPDRPKRRMGFMQDGES